MYTSKLINSFNLALAVVVAALLWRSLDWRVVGDAAIFHFIAVQMQMGAVPYRDIVDINMPLIYLIHAAIVTVGGVGDVVWRVFDLTAAVLMSGLILMLVWPAGRAAAIHAVLIVLVIHLLLGPYAAGQRDYLMSIPALGAALASAKSAEQSRDRWLYLVLAGAFVASAAAIKPTGILLIGLPVAARGGLQWRDAAWSVVGAATVGFLLLAYLALEDSLWPFIAMIEGLLPLYASLGSRTMSSIFWDTFVYLVPAGGLALAALLTITSPKPPRVRVMIGLTLVGFVHLVAQRKGWFYHVYPLAVGMACWGAWSLATLPMLRSAVCLTITLTMIAWRIPTALSQETTDRALAAASAMQLALESRLPRGATVQALDSDNGAFRAMARAGMRQATPHIQWFSLILASDTVRQDFVNALEADPPAAVLLTNSQWPRASGFDAADRWPQFAKLMTSFYHLDQTGDENGIAWRLYLRRNRSSKARWVASNDIEGGGMTNCNPFYSALNDISRPPDLPRPERTKSGCRPRRSI